MKTFSRVTATVVCLAMILSFMPMITPATDEIVAAASTSATKKEINSTAYEGLGFRVDNLQVPAEDIFGPGGNTVMKEQSELVFNYNASSNYGLLVRDNLNLKQNIDPNNRKQAGAIKLYGQYRNDDWSNLDEDNGYSYGSLGGQTTVTTKATNNTHRNRAYSTSTEYRSTTGKKDRVARVYIRSAADREDQSIVLEILKYENKVEKFIRSTTVAYADTTAKTLTRAGSWRNHEFDALIEVTAGDYDGDGTDEVAIYTADFQVRIYKTANDRISLWKTISTSDLQASTGYWANSDMGGTVELAPIITMASGDLNKDYTDELAIAVSMPMGSTKVHSNNHLFIYSLNRKEGKDASYFKEVAEIDLSDGTYAMDSANVAIGDMGGDGTPELVVAGWEVATAGLKTSTVRALHVEYRRSNGSWNVNSFQTIEASGHTAPDNKGTVAWYNSPVGLGVVNMGGLNGNQYQYYVFIRNILYRYDTDVKRYEVVENSNMEFLTKQKNNVDEDADKLETWVVKVLTGTFNGAADGEEQLIAVIGNRQKKDTGNEHWYWYQIAYISAKGTDSFYKGMEGVVNQGRSYINRTDGVSRASPYLDLSAPDIDQDSLYLQYIGAEAFYSKPEVQAILQSAPYFQDVADAYDNYLDDGSTSYGKGEGSSEGVTASVSASLGVYTSMEVSLFGSGEFEAEVAATVSYDHEDSMEVTTSREYLGNAGNDYVVMYAIPYNRYWYNAYDPNTGETTLMKIDEPMTPATVIVPVETYDEIAKQYKGLDPIRGNILKSTPGDPYSYMDWGYGDFEPIGDVQALSNAGSQSGSLVTVSQESVDTKTHSFQIGVEESIKVGGGAGFLGNNVTAGVTQSASVSAGGTYSNMSGVAYTGSVDNLPAGVGGYGFNWQFGISQIKFNGEDVIVVGYKTSNVTSGPKSPKNLNIIDIGSTAMTLEWEGTSDAAVYELCLVSNGMELPQATIPATDVDEDGMVRYTIEGLSPNRQYTFRVTAANSYGVRSVSGQDAVGTTLPENTGNFMITTQPEDQTAAPGLVAVFTIGASSTNKGAIGYQWQYFDENTRTWNIVGSNSPTLNIISNYDYDGRKYRCIVYQGDYFLRSKAVTLTVYKSPTATSIDIYNGNDQLENGDTVYADYVETSVEQVTVSEMSNEVKTIGSTEYVRYGTYDDSTGYVASDYWKKITSEGHSNEFYKISGETATQVTVKNLQLYSVAGIIEVVDTTPVPIDEITIDATEGITSKAVYYTSDGEIIYVGSDGELYLGGDMWITLTPYADDYIACIVDGPKIIVASDLVEYMREVQKTVDQDVITTKNGDILTLKADVKNNNNYVTDKAVIFTITNKETGESASVTGTLNGTVYEAKYAFPAAGAYGVVATYPGSGTYITSYSNEILIYAADDTESLSVVGGSITYGQAIELKPVLKSVSGTKAVNVTYTRITCDGEDVSLSLLNGNVFEPEKTGTYEISAKYNESGISSSTITTVNVYAQELIIRPADVTTGVNDSTSNMINLMYLEEGGDVIGSTDYYLSSRALTAKAIGEYPITVYLTDECNNNLKDKYVTVIQQGTFTLTEISYEVIAETGPNGTVHISYTLNDGNPVSVPSGSRIPEGADVTIVSQPDSGYGIKSWTVNKGTPTTTGVMDISKTFENITGDIDVYLSFAQAYNTLEFTALPEEYGTVTGVYTGGTATFESGDRINISQSVTITATPDDGYSIAGWEKFNSSTNLWETITNRDGTNYTGNKQIVSGVNGNTQYRVIFEEEESLIMEFIVYDRNYGYVDDAKILINGAEIREVVVDDYIYHYYLAYKHDNMEIEVVLPDNMLVDYWTFGNETVYGSVTKINVNDLQKAGKYNIYCVAPNTRTVKFEKALEDTNGGNTDGSAITAKRENGEIFATDKQIPQSAVVLFTAIPEDGYRVNRIVNVNEDGTETTVAGVDSTFYKTIVDVDINLKVYFEKKPVVTLTGNDEEGTITAQVGDNSIYSGDYVEFGSDVQVNILPDAGYVVDTVTVNGKAVLPEAAMGDNKVITLTNMQKNTEVEVVYKAKPIVTITAPVNGTIEVKGTKDFEEVVIEDSSYVDFDTTLTVTLTPDKGYTADDLEGVILGTAPNNSDVRTGVTETAVTKDITLTPTFTALDTYDVIYRVVDTTNDTNGDFGNIKADVSRKEMEIYETDEDVEADIIGTTFVYDGGEIALIAIANEGYRVWKWQIGGEDVMNNEALFVGSVLTLTSEQLKELAEANGGTVPEITVQFRLGDPRIIFSDPQYGTLSAETEGAPFETGGSSNIDVIFTAEALENYEIKEWTVNGEVVTDSDGVPYTEATYIFTPVDYDVTVAVVMQGIEINVTVTAGKGGTATVTEDTIRYGDTVTITALPDTGYLFEGWYIDDVLVEGALAVYEFTAEADVEYNAEFVVMKDITVTFDENDDTMGKITAKANNRGITSGDTVWGGKEVVFTAKPEDGYRIVSWDGIGTAEVSDDKTTVTVGAIDESMDVIVNFELIPIRTVTMGVPERGTIAAQIDGADVVLTEGQFTVPDGTEVTFVATPDANWTLESWAEALTGETARTVTIPVTSDITVDAIFTDAVNYDVTFNVHSTGGGDIEGYADNAPMTPGVTSQHVGGSKLVFTAIPDIDKMVKLWTLVINGEPTDVSDNITNLLEVEELTATTTVEVEYEDLVLYDLPADTEDYVIVEADIVKWPVDPGTLRQIRDRGNVTFTVAPAENKAIVSLTVSEATGETVDVIRNTDGTYTVNITGINSEIVMDIDVVDGKPVIIVDSEEGTLTVKKNGEVITNGEVVLPGDVIEVKAKAANGYKLSKITLNGETYKNKYTVLEEDIAITIEAVYKKSGSGGGGGGGGGGGISTYTVKFETNGAEENIAELKVNANTTVTRPADPVKDGYTFGGWYTEEELTNAFDFTTKVVKNYTLYAKWTEVQQAPWENPFEDVDEDDWYYDAVEYANENNLFNGLTAVEFGPDGVITRAMLVTVLYRAEGNPEVEYQSPFTDLENGAYYENAVAWAYANGIVKGYTETMFAPDENIIREQIAAIMYRYAEYKEYDTSVGENTNILSYVDVSEISEYAIPAVQYAVGSGLMKGKSASTINPKDGATRAEVAAILQRFIEANK